MLNAKNSYRSVARLQVSTQFAAPSLRNTDLRLKNRSLLLSLRVSPTQGRPGQITRPHQGSTRGMHHGVQPCGVHEGLRQLNTPTFQIALDLEQIDLWSDADRDRGGARTTGTCPHLRLGVRAPNQNEQEKWHETCDRAQ